MEEILKETAKQVPALVVLVIQSWMHLKAQSESRREFISMIREIHDENVAARELTREVIKENTTSNNNLTNAVQQLEQRIRQSHT